MSYKEKFENYRRTKDLIRLVAWCDCAPNDAEFWRRWLIGSAAYAPMTQAKMAAYAVERMPNTPIENLKL